MNIKLPVRIASILVNGVPQGWCFRDADGNIVHQDDIVAALNTASYPVASMRVALAIETLRAEGPSAEERIAAALEILETPVEEERTP